VHNSVTSYDISSAVLTLEHKFPAGSKLKANVDINLLLNSLESTDTRVGEWINVMGYITLAPSMLSLTGEPLSDTVFVQAIALWSAGCIRLQEYEKVLGERIFEHADQDIIHHDP
jgi:hypothetical protein